MYDAVYLIAKGLDALDHSQKISTKPLDCDQPDTWEHGNSLINYMKMVFEEDGTFSIETLSKFILSSP